MHALPVGRQGAENSARTDVKAATVRAVELIDDPIRATNGQLWDLGYHFAKAPTKVVDFRRSGD